MLEELLKVERENNKTLNKLLKEYEEIIRKKRIGNDELGRRDKLFNGC